MSYTNKTRKMKNIALSILTAATLASCGTPSPEADVTPSTNTISTEVATQAMVAATDTVVEMAETDAVSSATSVVNQGSFNGTLVIPPQNEITVTLPIDGIVQSTSLLAGSYVRKGDLLATMVNPAFIDLQQNFLDSHAQTDYLESEYNRQKNLSEQQAASQKKLQQSRADYLSVKSRRDAAAAQLSILDISTDELLNKGISSTLAVHAPSDGYIGNVEINQGKHVMAGEPLCEIINKSRVMLRLIAYEKDLEKIKVGDRIAFRVNGMGDRTFNAELVSIGQRVDNINRSLELYARALETTPEFRPGMYITARISNK